MAHEHTHVLHVESHFASGNLVRDIVIGMSDGLTVPFALAAGLTGAVSMTKIIVLAGLAEIAAGILPRKATRSITTASASAKNARSWSASTMKSRRSMTSSARTA